MFTMICYVLFLALRLAEVQTKVYFKEEFSNEEWEQRWIPSQHSSKNWGNFLLTPGRYYGDQEINKGIQTLEDSKHYGLTTKFEPFSNKDNVLVLQFSVKHEQDIQCGGAYIKLFDCSLNPKNFHAYVPYLIMFGPDICGARREVKVIFNYKGRKLAMKREIPCRDDHYTHIYTLIIKPDNTYIVKIDNKVERNGKLEEDWDFFPPLRNTDSKVMKLKSLDDYPKIENPDHVKTDNWNQPEFIPDPNAIKPADWQDINGEWEPPMIKNPHYNSEWKSRLIDNPNHKRPWIHPLRDNSNNVYDPDLYKYDEICGVGFDLWQVESGTVFDNILITDNELEAEKHGEETWGATIEKEKIMRIREASFAAIKKKESSSKLKPIRHDEF